MRKILVIDDERSIRNVFKDILEREEYEIDVAENGKTGLEKIKNETPDLIIYNIKIPEMDGVEVLEKAMEIDPELTFIMITGHGDVDLAVASFKKGAYDFIQKPLDLKRLQITIKNAMERNNLITETKQLKKKVSKRYELVGESEPMQKVKAMIDRVAPTDARVLITGENGTGKELVAHQLHEKSKRAKAPFVEVNCAAIPSELIESELFGHEKGAFTSAHKQRKGKFEQAHGGTIFLDEIGDMSLSAQAKVLRALQENKISRVGSDKDINVDVRLIAATNKNLRKEIDNNNFREDLYHRISVIIIDVPPLKERTEDIPLLADHFLAQICADHGIPKREITNEAIEKLKSFPWTGNVREFSNLMERLVILCQDKITAKDIDNFGQPLI
jgi:two-component system, NtrC family, nitrogen regulation response regulator NtrX